MQKHRNDLNGHYTLTLQIIWSCLNCTILLDYFILERTSHMCYCCIGVGYYIVGLDLFKKTEYPCLGLNIFLLFYFNCILLYLWYITCTNNLRRFSLYYTLKNSEYQDMRSQHHYTQIAFFKRWKLRDMR